MPKSTVRDLADEEILRFARFSVAETGANSFTQLELDTQLSIERGVIWLIHAISFEFLVRQLDDPAAGGQERMQIQVTRETKTGIVNYNDADLIEQLTVEQDRAAAIGTDAGPMYHMMSSPIVFPYVPPIPYAAQSIFIGVLGTATTATTARGRIHYTIRTVSEKFFFRVAQALIG